jgi:hypothetical protein
VFYYKKSSCQFDKIKKRKIKERNASVSISRSTWTISIKYS